MVKAVELSKKISKDLEKNWLPELEEINLHKLFEPVYRLSGNISQLNAIVAYIILAYDNDSSWLNIKADRYSNKLKIINSISDDKSALILSVIENENESVNDVIANYLENQTTWKWKAIMSLLDFYINTMRFVNQKTETEKTFDKINKEGEVKQLTQDYDIDVVTKVQKQKGELLEQAIDARTKADSLLSEIKKEFVQLDHAVQGDFAFEMTDEKRIDPMSWRAFIRHKVIPLRKQAIS
jgi:hypothetical protein